jgi:hypothetical protein
MPTFDSEGYTEGSRFVGELLSSAQALNLSRASCTPHASYAAYTSWETTRHITE